MKEFLKDFAIVVVIYASVFAGVLAMLFGIPVAYEKISGTYLVEIECTNCDKYRFCCTRIPKGKPVPPPPYKCDVCGNMTGIRRKK